jgi:hypothetical protein
MDNELKVKTGETYSMNGEHKICITILGTMSSEKRPLGRYRHKWKNNDKIYLKNTD